MNSCTSFLFLPDATFKCWYYGELFKLTTQQLDLQQLKRNIVAMEDVAAAVTAVCSA